MFRPSSLSIYSDFFSPPRLEQVLIRPRFIGPNSLREDSRASVCGRIGDTLLHAGGRPDQLMP